jgi:hypothetical protein
MACTRRGYRRSKSAATSASGGILWRRLFPAPAARVKPTVMRLVAKVRQPQPNSLLAWMKNCNFYGASCDYLRMWRTSGQI